MKQKIRSVLLFIMAIAMIFGVAGCGNKYHAVLYSKANEWIDEDFLKENRIRGIYYPVDDYYVEDENNRVDDGYYLDRISPSSRTFIIADEHEFSNIFTKCSLDINFENKVVVLYIFGDVYQREYHIKNIKLKDHTLNIYYKIESNHGKGDAVEIYQRCFMVVLDKLDMEAVEFIEQN